MGNYFIQIIIITQKLFGKYNVGLDIKDPTLKTKNETKEVNINHAIMSSITYCKKNKIDAQIIEGIEKLLIYGTLQEKEEFLSFKKYFFPSRLEKVKKVNLEDLISMKNKGYQLQCWQDNCRMEKVCDLKKSCSRICQLVGVGCLVAGTAITQYYTGGVYPTASVAVGAVAEKGCTWACEDWICEDIEDCQEVQKCDSHCENVWVNDNADQIDSNTGQVIHI